MEITMEMKHSYYDLVTSMYHLFEAKLHGMDEEYLYNYGDKVEASIYDFIGAFGMNRAEVLETFNLEITTLENLDDFETLKEINTRFKNDLFEILHKIFGMHAQVMQDEATDKDLKAIKKTMGYVVAAYEKYLEKVER